MRTFFREYLFVLGPARSQLPVLVLMMLVVALLDTIGLGLIFPLIALVVGGDAFAAPGEFGLRMLGDRIEPQLLVLVVMAVFIVKAFASYLIQRRLTRFSEAHRSQLILRLMAAYLAQPYELHLGRNSAVAVNEVVDTTWVYANGILLSSLRLLTDALMFLAVVGFLAWVNWLAMALGTLAIIGLMGVYANVLKGQLGKLGSIVGESSAAIVQSVSQGLEAFREVRILGVEDCCLSRLKAQTTRYADANSSLGALTPVPKYLIECSLVMLLLTLALLVAWRKVDAPAVLPVLGLFGVAAIRLMPGITNMIVSINNLRMSRYALRDLARAVHGLEGWADKQARTLGSRSTSRATLPFREVRFEGVTYTYPDTPSPAVRELSFRIVAGQAVGIVGRSGAGKSTLADILLGLLQPQQGRVLADGRNIGEDPGGWMRRLAYIPQVIYLTDDTLRRNIAFGVDDASIDAGRLERAVATARLKEVVENLPSGLDTVVGERGVRLSGGQRQRVALARAFYHDRELIVMDEATTSLDHETEQEVVTAVRTLHGKKTLVIIAHRESTLEGCDLILRMDGGKISEMGDFASLARLRENYERGGAGRRG